MLHGTLRPLYGSHQHNSRSMLQLVAALRCATQPVPAPHSPPPRAYCPVRKSFLLSLGLPVRSCSADLAHLGLHLDSQVQCNGRLWRRLARAAARQLLGDPGGRTSPWECRAAQSHPARPEEALLQGPSWGTAKGRALSVLSHLAMARGWYGVPCEGARGQAALCLRYVQPAGSRCAYPARTVRRPGCVRVTQACAWRWPPNPNPSPSPSPNEGGALTVLVHFARASFCVTYSTSAMPLAIFCSVYTHSEMHEMNFLSDLLLSSAKAGARLAKARPAATSGTARRLHMAADRGVGGIIFSPDAQAAKRRSASNLESMMARCLQDREDRERTFGGISRHPENRSRSFQLLGGHRDTLTRSAAVQTV